MVEPGGQGGRPDSRAGPAATPSTEPVAIIGGSVVATLAGRIRRPHTIADVERPTAELALTVPGPRGRRAAGAPTRPVRGRVAAAVAGALAAAGAFGALYAGGGHLAAEPIAGEPVAAPTTGPAGPAPLPDPVAPILVEQSLSAPSPDPGPDARQVSAYLAALRAANLPAGSGGRAESEAAQAICEQLDRGTSTDDLARALPALLPGVSPRQAPTVIELAERYYCP